MLVGLQYCLFLDDDTKRGDLDISDVWIVQMILQYAQNSCEITLKFVS